MAGRLVREVLENAPYDLTALETLVLVALAETARENDRTARRGADSESLADMCRTTPGSIRNVLLKLKARGLIVPLYDKPRKGLAQNYRLPVLTPAHRGAVLNGHPVPHKASPHSDA